MGRSVGGRVFLRAGGAVAVCYAFWRSVWKVGDGFSHVDC